MTVEEQNSDFAAARARALTEAIDAGHRPPLPPGVTADEVARNELAARTVDGLPQPVHERDRVNQWWYANHVPRDSEHAHLFHQPAPYELAGETPDARHYHVGVVLEAARAAGLTPTPIKGLVLDLSGPNDRFFVSFNAPDIDHAEQWFNEASGGGHVWNAAGCGGTLAAVIAFRSHLFHMRRPGAVRANRQA